MWEELMGCVDWASMQGPGSVPVDPKDRAYFENSSLPDEQPHCVWKLTEFAGSLDLGITSLSWAGLFPWKQSFILFILGVEYHLGVHNCVL